VAKHLQFACSFFQFQIFKLQHTASKLQQKTPSKPLCLGETEQTERNATVLQQFKSLALIIGEKFRQ